MPIDLNKQLALCIAAYQEDPNYLQKCLISVKRLTYPRIKVIMVIDGNSDDDSYMMKIFQDVLGSDKAATYVWKSNYHQKGPGESDKAYSESLEHMSKMVRMNQYVCIMQMWGGKREVMYTAFKTLGRTVDYVQVCDSDTVLDPACSVEMMKVLETDPIVGGVGGDVEILNKYESWVSFLSSVRYWMAFNMERACQSYFGCVQCISGPLGMYRTCLVLAFLEDWYGQTFLGSHCNFGDDRHLTNRVLSLGYATKYTTRSRCLTETPASYLRWLNQQTRQVITGFFPLFLIFTIIQLVFSGRLWSILLFLLMVQAVALIRSSMASCLRGSIVMFFMSFYSVLYMSSLLPAKIFAMVTISRAGWGTSGRKTIVSNLIGLVPISVWFAIILSGCVFTVIKETKKPFPEIDQTVLIIGAVVYIVFWITLCMSYQVFIRRWKKREQQCDVILEI
ncbi:hypothetical protein AAFF_G00034900 [Aldrovandia affinis]|uniref:Hyaluronan synthase 2 n=1 Tax=Aldrovandia affinis TaxID=143900 RepID=A0AAD7S3J1_9TELE|nr:hypothetical protein AAFF_G00034900 [Aldrovandia affinis]